MVTDQQMEKNYNPGGPFVVDYPGHPYDNKVMMWGAVGAGLNELGKINDDGSVKWEKGLFNAIKQSGQDFEQAGFGTIKEFVDDPEHDKFMKQTDYIQAVKHTQPILKNISNETQQLIKKFKQNNPNADIGAYADTVYNGSYSVDGKLKGQPTDINDNNNMVQKNDPNALVWVNKGPNKLQVKQSIADQWVSEGKATPVDDYNIQEDEPGKKDLKSIVEQQALEKGNNVLANKEYVNGVFKALHGRDANQAELNEFTNKGVQDVYNAIKAGAPGGKSAEDVADKPNVIAPSGQTISPQDPNYQTFVDQGAQPLQTGPASTGNEMNDAGAGTDTEQLENAVVEALDAAGASGTNDEIMKIYNDMLASDINPHFKQLIAQAQGDLVTGVNRMLEDRVRQLQTENFQAFENVRETQANLEARGLTFSGEGVRQLGTLGAFGDELTPKQKAIEGKVPMVNRLISESSRAAFERNLQDMGTQFVRNVGTSGFEGLDLPGEVTTQQQTVGTLEKSQTAAKDLAFQAAKGNVEAQEDLQNLLIT